MANDPISLRPLPDVDLARFEAVLEANGLPRQDVRTTEARFYVASDGGQPIGYGGIERPGPRDGGSERPGRRDFGSERTGSNGLLRSVVVREPHRGNGYGRGLCRALETAARDEGIDALYLLTTTAAAFFRQCGYEEVARETVPPGIRQTSEFASLCPMSATCMTREIGDRDR